MARRTRHATRTAQAKRLDILAGVALMALSVAILAAPFVWCIYAPVSFAHAVWGV